MSVRGPWEYAVFPHQDPINNHDRCLIDAGVVPAMREILAQSPECCFRVMGSMCSRLRELVVQIDEITLHNGTYRLVAYLLRQLPPDAEHARDIQLSIRKNVIASRLSLQPETFSRILANLRKADLIDTEGAHIVLKDVGGLRRLLEA